MRGFKICPGMLTISDPLVATSLRGSDPPKTCYLPWAAQVQDIASGNKLSKWASTQSLAHPPTYEQWIPEGPLAYVFGMEENKVNVSPEWPGCHPYFSVALS